jgi:ABC-type multidrug transport system ATPase subunit
MEPSGDTPAGFEARLVLEGVSRSFGRTQALAPASLRLGPGAVCLVTGPNGSGKSTLLRIAAGIIRSSTGRRWVAGSALYLRPGDGARHAQTPRQAVEFVARTRGRGRADDALEAVGLSRLADTPVGRLSSGERARVSLAVALVWSPGVACLDEPTAHLDHAGASAATEVTAALAAGGAAVLVATHDEGFLADRADARLRLARGRLEVTR